VNPLVNAGLMAVIAAERYLPVKSLPGVTLFLRARRP
jgi:energy-converting hydrogenase Eha subunit C